MNQLNALSNRVEYYDLRPTFIAVMRDPVARALSYYSYIQRKEGDVPRIVELGGMSVAG